ncbi:MAG: hypothetical protein R3C14_08980 [Caldilineaceae bacterium]
MTRTLVLPFLLCILLLTACQPIQPVTDASPPAPMEQTLSWDEITLELKIADAMSAGPVAIARDATILDWPTDASNGEWPVLREGNNGWTCITDDWGIANNTPTDDPMCLDDAWVQWFKAFWNGEEPAVTTIGISYMYQGGTVADNNELVMAPPAGQPWQFDPPHIMLLFPGEADLSAFPSEMSMGAPYLMWGDTPYKHIMAPIVTESLAPVDPSDRIGNAMSAAPHEIAAAATIIDWPTDGTADFPVLREGSNGWTCIPDDNVLEQPTLANDPMCMDAMWVEWLHALFEGREPNITQPGIIYVLQGGSAADMEDPSVMTPAEGAAWQMLPPHLAVLYPGGLDENAWSHDHTSGAPYIMWGGTPYEHLMIPVDPVVTGAIAAHH